MYPASAHEKHIVDTDPLCLMAANGSPINSHGRKDIVVRLAGRTYTWSFRLADVTQPLLGADFLAHNHLLVDVAGQKLITADSYTGTPCFATLWTPSLSVLLILCPSALLLQNTRMSSSPS